MSFGMTLNQLLETGSTQEDWKSSSMNEKLLTGK